MKKFIILSLVALFIIALHANGECLLKDIHKKGTCSGNAANLNNENTEQKLQQNQNQIQSQENSSGEQNSQQNLKQIYKIPTMATPFNFYNGFPALNQNCMFGACFPDLK